MNPKARELKKCVELIRKDYTQNMSSEDDRIAKLAVTTYLVDKLALRAGGEKDDDLADTVGVCTLRVRALLSAEPDKLRLICATGWPRDANPAQHAEV